MSRFLPIVCVLILSIPFAASAGEPYKDRALIAFLDSLTDSKSFYPRTLDFLFEIKNPESLVALTNYYIGEGGSEDLGQLITQMGYEVLPQLQSELKLPIKCVQKYMKACKRERTDKTREILEYIKAIKSGQVLCPELDDCPAPNPSFKRDALKRAP